MTASTVADLVRRHRSSARLSQEELAERAGLSVRTISSIESGAAKTPRAITVSLLAEALGLDAPSREHLLAALVTVAEPAQKAATTPTPAFFGRERERVALRALFDDPAVRLLTLIGPPGVGKSSLAARVAADLRMAVPIVDLAVLDRDDALLAAIMANLGIRETAERSQLAALAEALSRPSLVVLDGIERISSAADDLSELLGAAPQLRIVATSREPLRLTAESVFVVEPLSPDAAVALLHGRVRARRADLDTAIDDIRLRAIVDALDRLPLAIELVADALGALPIDAVVARLDERMSLLGGDTPAHPARHRTMRAAVAWSYDALPEHDRDVFEATAVFHAPFTIEAAVAASGTSDAAERVRVLRSLVALVERGLLRSEESLGDVRFVPYAVVRDFALERLEARMARADVQMRVARYCGDLVTTLELDGGGVLHRGLPVRFEREAETFAAALEWAREAGAIDVALQLANGMRPMWWIRGRYREGVEVYRALLPVAERQQATCAPKVLARAYNAASTLAATCGDFAAADRYAQANIDIDRRFGNGAGVADMLSGMGMRACDRGNYQRAFSLFEESLNIYRAYDSAMGIASLLCNLGQCALQANDPARARAWLEEGHAAAERARSPLIEGGTLALQALAATYEPALERAESLAERAFEIGKKLGHRMLEATAMLVRAKVAASRSSRAAGTLARDAIAHAGDSGDIAFLAGALDVFAAIESPHRPAFAARCIGVAERLRARTGIVVAAIDAAGRAATIARIAAAIGPDALDRARAEAVSIADLLGSYPPDEP